MHWADRQIRNFRDFQEVKIRIGDNQPANAVQRELKKIRQERGE